MGVGLSWGCLGPARLFGGLSAVLLYQSWCFDYQNRLLGPDSSRVCLEPPWLPFLGRENEASPTPKDSLGEPRGSMAVYGSLIRRAGFQISFQFRSNLLHVFQMSFQIRIKTVNPILMVLGKPRKTIYYTTRKGPMNTHRTPTLVEIVSVRGEANNIDGRQASRKHRPCRALLHATP